MEKKTILVLLQAAGNGLHPISRQVMTTAVSLGRQKGLLTRGVLFCEKLSSELEERLERSGLDEAVAFEHEAYRNFVPETQAAPLAELARENTEILLFPATPEGRTLSAMVGAALHTGVTADCTALSFTEDGLLLQTRPAFSGSMMADIVTRNARPQMASLRFGREPEEREGKTAVFHRIPEQPLPIAGVSWLDRTEGTGAASEIILAVGGGLRAKEDLELFRRLAEKLGAELCCSRLLADRGWLTRKEQIGLSGRSVSPRLLIAFGISGSVQFQAGLEQVGTLIAVNSDRTAPLMRRADLPVEGDLYEIAEEMLRQLNS